MNMQAAMASPWDSEEFCKWEHALFFVCFEQNIVYHSIDGLDEVEPVYQTPA